MWEHTIQLILKLLMEHRSFNQYMAQRQWTSMICQWEEGAWLSHRLEVKVTGEKSKKQEWTWLSENPVQNQDEMSTFNWELTYSDNRLTLRMVLWCFSKIFRVILAFNNMDLLTINHGILKMTWIWSIWSINEENNIFMENCGMES